MYVEVHTFAGSLYMMEKIIGWLKYLAHTRMDIENIVVIITIFQVDLKESHYATTKSIFRYLKETPKFWLWYDRSNDFTLYAYIYFD